VLVGLPENEGIVIEGDDDVVRIDEGGRILFAYQDKHSFNDIHLTISSREAWKTLRSWLDILQRGRLHAGARLVLRGTGTIAPGDPLELLTKTTRDEGDIEALAKSLSDVAQHSENTALQQAFDAWNALSDVDRLRILRQADIEPAKPKLAHAQHELQAALRRRGVPENLVPTVEQALVGWFYGELESRLGTKTTCKFESFEIQGALWELAGWYGPAEVLYEHAADEVPTTIEEMKKDPTYLKQLTIIKAKPQMMTTAVIMFSRGNAEREAGSGKSQGA
jgi:hypothetical protein